MTDPRIEAAARALCEHNGHEPDANELALAMFKKYKNERNWEIYKESAQVALAVADAAVRARVVPFPIPDDRMETAKNTLLCWKGGALSDDDAIGMIVCGVSEPPVNSDALGGRDG